MNLCDMTLEKLADYENALRQQVARGLNNGCREYLIAVICEQGQRDIAACRDLFQRRAA